jgi:hypothetical protein
MMYCYCCGKKKKKKKKNISKLLAGVEVCLVIQFWGCVVVHVTNP